MNNVKFLLGILIALWLFGFLFVLNNNLSIGGSNGASRKGGAPKPQGSAEEMYEEEAESAGRSVWPARLKEAMRKLQKLESRNRKNEELIETLQENLANMMRARAGVDQESGLVGSFPSTQTEKVRRKVRSDIQDLSFYFKSQVSSLRTKSEEEAIDKFKANFDHRINVLLAEFNTLSNADELSLWRQGVSKQLTQSVQSKIDKLQNPPDCARAKKIICDLDKACGFGCQMHHVLYCFITSYATERTLVIESDHWRYNPRGYEAYFKPVASENCRQSKSINRAIVWGETGYESADAVKMPIVDVLTHRASFMPLAVPKELLPSLERIHGAPFVWWAGQLLAYLMRFNAEFGERVGQIKEKLGFTSPCVGVHVRRTDKVGAEASFHAVDEYMRGVDDFYRLHEQVVNQKLAAKKGRADANFTRSVYLASDDVKVLSEARRKYPEYNFIFDESFAISASVSNRYSPESALGVILDIHFLSQCDHLVCTFSSQVCRLAYELMQTRYPDASSRFTSLDDVYYYGGQTAHNVRAVMDHEPDAAIGEIELKVGDLIGIAGNHWNGYSKGHNRRTNQEGLFPSYKVEETVESF